MFIRTTILAALVLFAMACGKQPDVTADVTPDVVRVSPPKEGKQWVVPPTDMSIAKMGFSELRLVVPAPLAMGLRVRPADEDVHSIHYNSLVRNWLILQDGLVIPRIEDVKNNPYCLFMVDADIEKASELAVIKEASGTTFTLQPGTYHFTASGHGSSSTGANYITHQLYLPLRSDPSRFDVGAVTLLCGQNVSPGVNLHEASRLQEALGEHAKIEVLKTDRR